MKNTIATLLLMFTAVVLAQDSKPANPPADGRSAGWLKESDKNGDGKLAKAETRGLMERFFDRNDANKDGFLDRSELDALAKRLADNQGRRQPQQRRQRVQDTEELLRTAPKDVTIVPDLSYRKGESKAWKLDLVMPKAKSEKARPAIVFVHGGGWRNGDKRTGTFLRGAIEYAQKGYVCITVNYRLVDEAPFPACVNDVKNAVRWLRANAKKYNLDPKRIGAYGNSAGAHIVCMLLKHHDVCHALWRWTRELPIEWIQGVIYLGKLVGGYHKT
ncbi:MAG: alpha/beta hydrolase fold domain-containing protein [Akkermansiaceae bacterium]